MGRKVEERFSNGKPLAPVKNVGELIDELSRMPRDIPVAAAFTGQVLVVLWNAFGGPPGPCISLESKVVMDSHGKDAVVIKQTRRDSLDE